MRGSVLLANAYAHNACAYRARRHRGCETWEVPHALVTYVSRKRLACSTFNARVLWAPQTVKNRK
ncbi:hypothetical protein DLS42_13170 [Staphylococcus pseudintermedius]|nr:hypothetical protein DLS42_13170 [Staphylococcus pseudintermedius]